MLATETLAPVDKAKIIKEALADFAESGAAAEAQNDLKNFSDVSRGLMRDVNPVYHAGFLLRIYEFLGKGEVPETRLRVTTRAEESIGDVIEHMKAAARVATEAEEAAKRDSELATHAGNALFFGEPISEVTKLPGMKELMKAYAKIRIPRSDDDAVNLQLAIDYAPKYYEEARATHEALPEIIAQYEAHTEKFRNTLQSAGITHGDITDYHEMLKQEKSGLIKPVREGDLDQLTASFTAKVAERTGGEIDGRIRELLEGRERLGLSSDLPQTHQERADSRDTGDKEAGR